MPRSKDLTTNIMKESEANGTRGGMRARTASPTPIDRLKGLLRELFQLDTADLDFGLYRIFHLRRTEVETFLNEQLEAEADRAFAFIAGGERDALQKRVEELATRARETVSDDAILPSGEPNPEHASAKAVREYTEARAKLRAVEASDAQRADVFNLLYAFFSRYYDDGDFIARRFFGARASYAVPYNGEEVFFHWANKDQYYVKTGESFRDYAFIVRPIGGEYRVRFHLVEATTAKDNTKGDVRFFFPLHGDVAFDKASRLLTVPFEYRLPTEGEVAKYGKNSKGQEAVLEDAAPRILKAVPDAMLRAALAESSPTGKEVEGEPGPTLLRRRLAHFARKNTSDYFVHKNLGAFLRQELDFFVRDQVVHEADLEGDFDSKRRTIRVFRKLAEALITFLAQMEEAQKQLFEKKKFVLRTDYLVPVQQVPRALWPEVLANKAQLDEWKALYALEPKSDLFNLKGKINEHVLEQHPTLSVDTRHFPADFTLRLAEGVDDLNEQIDGTLIHGENFQALRLLSRCYERRINTVYIDPPYNTDGSPICYKNGYRSSSWVSLLQDRILAGSNLLKSDGIFCATIDDFQKKELDHLLEQIFSKHRSLGTICIRINPSGRITTNGLAVTHEYALFYGAGDKSALGRLPRTEQQTKRFKGSDRDGIFEWRNFRREGSSSEREARPRRFFPLFCSGKTVRVPKLKWEDATRRYTLLEKPQQGEQECYPLDDDGSERVWRWGINRTKDNLGELEARHDKAGKLQVYYKYRPEDDGVLAPSIWTDAKYSATEHGTGQLKKLFGERNVFSFPKSVYATSDCIAIAGMENEDATGLDYFAGSGTTAHAIINLNREDEGRRKFILVEMGEYFDNVLVQRIKKVIFSPDWSDGTPTRAATKEEAERTPRLIKIITLESYEDALHNTFSERTLERLAPREKAHKDAVGGEEYRIRYLLKLPLEASDSMLSLARLEHPFDYQMEVLTDHGPKTTTVDLVETFNWLYGLRAHRLLSWVNKEDKTGKDKQGRSYRAVVASDREGKKRVLVVWRDMAGLDPAVERPFLEAKAKEPGTFDERWINGDSAAKGFASLDGLFKRLMEEPAR